MLIEVREAEPGDGPAVAGLIQELARVSGEASPITVDYAENYLRAPGGHVILAEVEGEAIGLLSYTVRPNLYHAGPSAAIEELVVHRDERGRGVGSALVAELLTRLTVLGCVEVSVTTLPENDAAQRFYRAQGFVDEAIFLERHF